ncbi:Secreted protein OS=Streptomyces violarus OX=67380 GN=FHS41_002809 PE=4 SV=1 [Streptomyces violarus]
MYSLGGDRVWLVGEDETVTRTFGVHPSAVDPAPENYLVTSRSNAITGSDGVPIEHVVRFTSVDGVVIGFSAAVTDPTAAPAPT